MTHPLPSMEKELKRKNKKISDADTLVECMEQLHYFPCHRKLKKKKKLLWFAHVMHSVLYKKTKKNRQYKITRQLTWQKLLKTGKRKKFCDET